MEEADTREEADSDVEKGVGDGEGEGDEDEKREGEGEGEGDDPEADGPWPLLRMGKRRSVLLPEDISSDMMGGVMVLYGGSRILCYYGIMPSEGGWSGWTEERTRSVARSLTRSSVCHRTVGTASCWTLLAYRGRGIR